MRFALVLGTVLSLAAAGDAAAQASVATMPMGSRIRVTMPEKVDGREVSGTNRWVTGTLLSVDDTHVSLKVDGGGEDSELSAPFSAIGEIQVSRGMERSSESARRGLIRGAIVGAGVGLLPLGFGHVTGIPAKEDCGRDGSVTCDFFLASGSNVLRNGAIGVAAGGLIGYAVGARNRERWEPLRTPRFGLIVAPGGVAVRVATGR